MSVNNTMNEPLVSVIIPTYNRCEYLGEAIDSVLSQTYGNIEIIIVDDGSTDGTGKYVEEAYREKIDTGILSYFYREHSGISNTRNFGISRASGEFLAFLDSDDMWNENKLQAQMDYLLNHEECMIVSAWYRNFADDSNKPFNYMQDRLYNEDTNEVRFVLLCCRKTVFDICGLMDISLKTGEDTEWILRAEHYGYEIHMLSQVLYYRRIHENNVSYETGGNPEAMYKRCLLKVCQNLLKVKKGRPDLINPDTY